MKSDSRLAFQWLLLLIMFTVALAARELFISGAYVFNFSRLLAFMQSFAGSVLSIAIGCIVAIAVAANVDPAKVKPAARILMFPSSRRRFNSGTSSALVTSPKLELSGRLSRILLEVGVLVLVVSLVAQLLTGHLTAGGYVVEGLLLLFLIGLTTFSFAHHLSRWGR